MTLLTADGKNRISKVSIPILVFVPNMPGKCPKRLSAIFLNWTKVTLLRGSHTEPIKYILNLRLSTSICSCYNYTQCTRSKRLPDKIVCSTQQYAGMMFECRRYLSNAYIAISRPRTGSLFCKHRLLYDNGPFPR